MILWQDFVLDEFFGPMLNFPEERKRASVPDHECRVERWTNPNVMEDVSRGETRNIQETGREQQPARMVGSQSLDSFRTSMEAGRESLVSMIRQEEGA